MKTAFMLILKFYHKIKLNSALLAGVFFIAQLSLLFLDISYNVALFKMMNKLSAPYVIQIEKR